MKRYHFPLQSLGVIRAHREQVARAALANAVRSQAGAEQRLRAARLRATEVAQLQTAGRSGSFRAGDEVAFFHGYRRECAAALEADRMLAEATAELELRRRCCVEANREVKAIARLEAAARAAHRAAQFKAEQAEADELSGYRAARKNSKS